MPKRILWIVGVGQDYKLFDWIYRLNYKFEHQVYFTSAETKTTEKLDHTDFFPNSVRYVVMQLRLYDAKWVLTIGGEKRKELREDVPYRIASKYCKQLKEDGKVIILVTLRRVTFDNIDLKKHYGKRRIEFGCWNNEVTYYEF